MFIVTTSQQPKHAQVDSFENIYSPHMGFQNQSFSRAERRNMSSSLVQNSVRCGLCFYTKFYPVKLNNCIHQFCYECVWYISKREFQQSMAQQDDDDDEPWILLLQPSCPHCDQPSNITDSLIGTS